MSKIQYMEEECKLMNRFHHEKDIEPGMDEDLRCNPEEMKNFIKKHLDLYSYANGKL